MDIASSSLSRFRVILYHLSLYVLAILFTYAAVNKLMEGSDFYMQLKESPLLAPLAGMLVWAIPGIEIMAVVLLFSRRFTIYGLYLSVALMSAFTGYVFMIWQFSPNVPCSCGGILNNLGWEEHIYFNLFFLLLALAALFTTPTALNDKRKINTRKFKVTFILISLVGSIAMLAMGMTFIKKESLLVDKTFTRRYQPHKLKKLRAIDLRYNSYYIAGTDQSYVYLGNVTGYLTGIKVTHDLQDTTHFRIRAKTTDSLAWKRPKLRVFPPFFYLMDGVTPKIRRGKIETWQYSHAIIDSAFFDLAVPIGVDSFVMRSLQHQPQKFVLARLQPEAPYLKVKPSWLQNRSDTTIFDADGKLLYDVKSRRIAYSYYYQNKFITTDRNLKKRQVHRTIDSFQTMGLRQVNSTRNKKVLTGKSGVVNKASAVYDNELWINSNILGKDEAIEKFKNRSVLDIYNLQTGAYTHSVYLPSFNHQKATAFKVTANHLIAVYDHYLVSYLIE